MILSFDIAMPANELEDRMILCLRRAMPIGILFLAALGPATLRAQDVAEAARQARERKAAEQNSPHHVYTDEDLKRAKILSPQDVSRAVLSRNIPAAPSKPQVEIGKTEQEPAAETPSLGEVARQYRQEKLARQAEQAAKVTEPSHYQLDIPKAELATPKAPIGPLGGSLREDELRPMRRPFSGVPLNSPGLRVSPFVPRRNVTAGNSLSIVPLASMVASLQRKQVRPGDSWWKLARLYLGDGTRWAELLRVNPGLSRDPKRLLTGTIVFVPQSPRVRAAPPGPVLVVRRGDTLWSLARAELGCGAAWPQLAAANPEVRKFNQLQMGTKLRIPERVVAVCPAEGVVASGK